MQNEEKYLHLLKVKKVQLEMLKDRGYIIPNDEVQAVSSLQSFVAFYSTPPEEILSLREKKSKKSEKKIAKQQDISQIRQNLTRRYTHNQSVAELRGYNLTSDASDYKSGAAILAKDSSMKLLEKAQILVFYASDSSSAEDGKIGKSVLEDFEKLAVEKYPSLYQAIIISPTQLTPTGGQEILDKMIATGNPQVQIFFDSGMTSNITKHILQPKFTLLSHHEASEYLKQNKMTLQWMPQMLSDDPIAKYYGALPGRIFKIFRSSPLDVFNIISYRAVSPGVMPKAVKK